jgi:hypothetical protein
MITIRDITDNFPDGGFRYSFFLFLSLFDEGGDISRLCKFHKDIDNLLFAIKETGMNFYQVFVI